MGDDSPPLDGPPAATSMTPASPSSIPTTNAPAPSIAPTPSSTSTTPASPSSSSRNYADFRSDKPDKYPTLGVIRMNVGNVYDGDDTRTTTPASAPARLATAAIASAPTNAPTRLATAAVASPSPTAPAPAPTNAPTRPATAAAAARMPDPMRRLQLVESSMATTQARLTTLESSLRAVRDQTFSSQETLVVLGRQVTAQSSESASSLAALEDQVLQLASRLDDVELQMQHQHAANAVALRRFEAYITSSESRMQGLEYELARLRPEPASRASAAFVPSTPHQSPATLYPTGRGRGSSNGYFTPAAHLSTPASGEARVFEDAQISELAPRQPLPARMAGSTTTHHLSKSFDAVTLWRGDGSDKQSPLEFLRSVEAYFEDLYRLEHREAEPALFLRFMRSESPASTWAADYPRNGPSWTYQGVVDAFVTEYVHDDFRARLRATIGTSLDLAKPLKDQINAKIRAVNDLARCLAQPVGTLLLDSLNDSLSDELALAMRLDRANALPWEDATGPQGTVVSGISTHLRNLSKHLDASRSSAPAPLPLGRPPLV